MRWLKTLGLFCLVVLSVLIGVMLFLHNATMVSVDLIWFATPEAALAVWLMVFFALGLTLGVSISLVAYLWIRGRTWGLRRKVKRLEASQRTTPGTEVQA
ncbi:MAG: LapA family protein [Litorivicinus sp.]